MSHDHEGRLRYGRRVAGLIGGAVFIGAILYGIVWTNVTSRPKAEHKAGRWCAGCQR
jgi:hypothetical protein